MGPKWAEADDLTALLDMRYVGLRGCGRVVADEGGRCSNAGNLFGGANPRCEGRTADRGLQLSSADELRPLREARQAAHSILLQWEVSGGVLRMA